MLMLRKIFIILWISYIECQMSDFDQKVGSLLGYKQFLPPFKKPGPNFQIMNPADIKPWNVQSFEPSRQNFGGNPTTTFTVDLPDVPLPNSPDAEVDPAFSPIPQGFNPRSFPPSPPQTIPSFESIRSPFQNLQALNNFVPDLAQKPNFFTIKSQSVPNLGPFMNFQPGKFPINLQNGPFSLPNFNPRPQINNFNENFEEQSVSKGDDFSDSSGTLNGQMQSIPHDLSMAAVTAMKMKHPLLSSANMQQLLRASVEKLRKTAAKNQEESGQEKQEEHQQIQNQQETPPPPNIEIVFSSNPSNSQFEQSIQFRSGAAEPKETITRITNQPNMHLLTIPAQQKFTPIH